MGSMSLDSMLDMPVAREAVMNWHLESNHYPPVPLSMAPVCWRAVELAFQEEWHEKLDLPDDVTYRGWSQAPVAAIVESFHLQAFVDAEWRAVDE